MVGKGKTLGLETGQGPKKEKRAKCLDPTTWRARCNLEKGKVDLNEKTTIDKPPRQKERELLEKNGQGESRDMLRKKEKRAKR